MAHKQSSFWISAHWLSAGFVLWLASGCSEPEPPELSHAKLDLGRALCEATGEATELVEYIRDTSASCEDSQQVEVRGPLSGDAGIPNSAAGTWVYHDVAGAKCRDGSPAGVSVQRGTVNKLLIYFEGGSACFSDLSCKTNPSNLNPADSARCNSRAPAGRDFWGNDDPRGLFDRQNPQNPVRDWHFVFIPYCTGDLHLGTRENDVPDAGLVAQKFFGRRNLDLILKHVVPSFPNLTQLLVAGRSAGGGAAAGNAVRIREAFRTHPTHPQNPPMSLLVDAAPFLSGAYFSSSADALWVNLWGLESSLIADCPTCRNAAGRAIPNALHEYARTLSSRFGGQPALLMGKQDLTLSALFVLTRLASNQTWEQACEFDMQPALDDFRQRLGSSWATYYVTEAAGPLLALEHTWTQHEENFYTVSEQPVGSPQESISMVEWVAEYLAGGTPPHVGT